MNSTVDGSGKNQGTHPEYIAFGLVPVFFLLGLLGVFICHVLKKKGYRCTTDAEEPEEPEGEEKEHLQDGVDLNDTYSEGNTDTVGQIVHYIMKNEANTDALAAMITGKSTETEGVPATPTTPTTPGSPATPMSPAAPAGAAKHTCNHLHTIGGAVGHNNMCNRCSQKKWPHMRHGFNRRMERRTHAGEVTVLAVGRFRVTKTDPRPARERCSLLITEPNGSVPSTPVKSEPSQNSSIAAQPKVDSGDNK